MLGCFVNKTDASRTVNIVREHLHETILHGRTIICKLWRMLYVIYCRLNSKNNFIFETHNKKYHSGIRGIYITNTSTTMVFANEKTRSTTITVPRLLLPFP